MLSLQEQWYHLIVLCCCVFNKWTIIGASGISFAAGYRLTIDRQKPNKTLILEKMNIIISFPTLFQTLTNVQKGFIIAVATPSVITPKEALTVHVRQVSLEMVKTAQVIIDSYLTVDVYLFYASFLSIKPVFNRP